MIQTDEEVCEIVAQVNNCIDESFAACKVIVSYLSKYSFLWAIDITQAFKEFLRSSKSHDKLTVSKNFMSGTKYGFGLSVTKLT
jgi:hypothetical protein